ncbi:MAG: PLP-dependent aminotransferase family protein [Candidatus Subteraquimicrobiales bacterium]|nr:PLP-dependent aminotransferase family protein [Candidatus Subteraquimicrobiales bacterium]
MTELIFDKWAKLYAERTKSMRSSEIRDLLNVTARPDIISFSGGLPETKSFPMEIIVEIVRHLMHKEGSVALQYGNSEGYTGLVSLIVNLMKEIGIDAEEEEIIITDGAQQGLELLGKVFINPGDTVIVEAPSYVGGLQAFSSYQANLVSVPLDKDGLRTDLLKDTLENLKKQKKIPKFLYTVPTFHNPAGVTLSLERRKELLSIVKEYDLLVVEDDPYSWLQFEGERLRSLKSLDESIVYLSTFSKIFAPGLRIGWVAAPRPIIEKLIFAKQAADLCSSSFTQRVIAEYFSNYPWKIYLNRLIDIYLERRNAMIKALEEFFPQEASWTNPGGGLFLWANLPDYVDTTEMLAEAINEAKVSYVPGRAFFADRSGQNYMRLNFSYPSADEIYEGIKRLAKVAKTKISLYQAFAKKLHLDE